MEQPEIAFFSSTDTLHYDSENQNCQLLKTVLKITQHNSFYYELKLKLGNCEQN